MAQPLLEPAVLVSENCPACRGTGEREDDTIRGAAVVPCDACDGQARLVREVPFSEAWTMMQASHARVVAPPPSMLREGP